MLQNLHVKNLALIDEIEVEFEKGLNILTGETGAGKSIILGSVSLALGGRYTRDMIRKGTSYGLVELVFHVEHAAQIEKLEALDIYPEDGMVVLSRRLMDGRSISRINGETVTMAVLKEVAAILIDIHGQHEHQSLLCKKNHLEIVDAFARENLGELPAKTAEAFREYQKKKNELSEAAMDEGERAKELAFLRFEAEEITEANLQTGEDEELEVLYRRMVHGRKIADYTAEAYASTSEGEVSASENLSRAIHAMGEIREYDERALELYHQLVEVDSLLNDFNRELSDYSSTCEYSEEELYETETRLNEVNRLKMKYGNSIEKIQEYLQELEEKIQKLEDYEGYMERLKADCREAEEHLKYYTTQLSEIRKEQALILEKEIVHGLTELNFPDVRFAVSFGEGKHYTAAGKDDVEFLIALNPGQPLKPLADVASGGELSRIMLAIKTVMAKRDDIETLIFDEIDVGISGRTAQKVSEKMALIGRNHQVICITHLAQIAAMADTHYVIEKKIDAADAKTEICRLSEGESITELARILGGAKITDTVLKNAAEMRELAKETKEK